MNELFDIENTDDLPFDVPKPRGSVMRERMMELMEVAGQPVSVNQMRAALYRKHGKDYSTTLVSTRMSDYASQGLLRRTAKGVYEYVEQD